MNPVIQKTILIDEDDQELLLSLKSFFEMEGYLVKASMRLLGFQNHLI
jgi:hypothetical protein